MCTHNICFHGEIRKYYSKCSEISHSKVANKMAYTNSADPDQTAPEGASGSTPFH